jgi:hypothetical protein
MAGIVAYSGDGNSRFPSGMTERKAKATTERTAGAKTEATIAAEICSSHISRQTTPGKPVDMGHARLFGLDVKTGEIGENLFKIDRLSW